MIDASAIAAAIGVPCLVSGDMQQKMQLWEDMYENKAAWQNKRVRPMRLPAAIARELKRLTLTEFTAEVSDTELNSGFQAMVPKLRRCLDMGLSMGGLLLKPYYAGDVLVDIVPQNAYLPVNYTDCTCDGVICPEEIAVGKTYYTRLEQHTYDRNKRTHTIRQRCFKSGMPGILGTECSLAEVPQWADILPEKVYENVQRPLFAVFQNPDANNIDPTSPLGVSVYGDAVGFIRDADVQWERTLWELESSERAVNASADLFRYVGGKPVLPKGRERMYQIVQTADNKPFMETFSPEIRDTAYFNSLNQMLRRIESAVGLAYGTFSEVSDVEKTAEEVRASKQRSFVRVGDIQANLRTALDDLVYGMQYYRDYYANRTQEQAELSCTFGDGVLEDADKEFQRRMQMVSAGLYSKEQFVMWYFGCDAEKASEYLPKQEDDGGLFSGSET
ncbi:phage capsid protein [Ruminococcus sp.]|uniref:phage capsid protein n=1 Tax=Ruminococcus sp. TaxID=41978 RepID=UPI0025FC4A5C|nr:phage capsid protein [Ruminococcus sp.]